MPKRQSGNKKSKQSNFAKLSIFQPNKYKFKKSCPLSIKGAPKVDFKNIKLLKKYMSENGKILPSRITNVAQKKQRELSLSIKRARNLALIQNESNFVRKRKNSKASREVINHSYEDMKYLEKSNRTGKKFRYFFQKYTDYIKHLLLHNESLQHIQNNLLTHNTSNLSTDI